MHGRRHVATGRRGRFDPDESEPFRRSPQRSSQIERLSYTETVRREGSRVVELVESGFVYGAGRSPRTRGVDEDRRVDALQQVEQLQRLAAGNGFDTEGERAVDGEALGDPGPGRVVPELRPDAHDPDSHAAPLRSMCSVRKCVAHEMHGS